MSISVYRPDGWDAATDVLSAYALDEFLPWDTDKYLATIEVYGGFEGVAKKAVAENTDVFLEMMRPHHPSAVGLLEKAPPAATVVFAAAEGFVEAVATRLLTKLQYFVAAMA